MKVLLVVALMALAVAEPPAPGYLPPSGRGGQGGYPSGGPSSSYGAPSSFGGSSGGFGGSSGGSSGGFGGSSGGFGGNGGYSSGGGNGGYSSGGNNGYPSGGAGGAGGFAGYPGGSGSDGQNEPASYEFQYEVNDPASGSEYGHKESREGDVARGEYRVLLPDGRTQVVTYIADQNGYQPQIEYIGGENGGQGGPYPASGSPNNRGGQGGYPSGGGNNGYPSSGGNNGYPSSGGGFGGNNGGPY